MDTNEIVQKIKALVKQRNVTRIRIRRGENIILNIPMTAGVAGGVIGLIAAPWALIIAAVATVGADCTVEVEKENGEITVVYGKKQ
ncbi:MAG: DUF4342 domain-containing protein [Clostridia bacterium]|nr:DUF4342 domain-containing protein [Clostridia bacterium]